MLIVRKGDIYMYDNAMLEELKKLEGDSRFLLVMNSAEQRSYPACRIWRTTGC